VFLFSPVFLSITLLFTLAEPEKEVSEKGGKNCEMQFFEAGPNKKKVATKKPETSDLQNFKHRGY
jgi:hypothetical protein